MTNQALLKCLLLFLAFCSIVLAQTGSLQVRPSNGTLFTQSNYLVTYFPVRNVPASATFQLDFKNTYIVVPNASLNVSATVSGTPVTGATGNCSNQQCTLRLGSSVNAFSDISFSIGFLTNPYFLMNQPMTTRVTFNASYQENLSWTIPGSYYTPLPIVLNSMSQSNYGVGNTGVTYTFNLSLPMTPSNPQLAVNFPSQVGIGNLVTTISFYGSIQNISPFVSGSSAFFQLISTGSNSPGFLLLTLSGLINPQSIGSSSSFSILLQLSLMPNSGGSCSNCRIALIDSNLIARSTVAGNINTLSWTNSNSSVGQINNISIYSQLLASIPQGGRYQITLPPSVSPVVPISCSNIYAFTLTSSSPICSYNSASNTVTTNNFFFSGIGGVVFAIVVINPPDTRSVNFTFQTFDAQGNMIGNSTQPYTFTAVPLLLQAKAAKNQSQVDTPFKLAVNVTLGAALTQNDRIIVTLPPARYSLSNILCNSGSINIPCTITIDSSTDNLIISTVPPCSQCTTGSSLSFSIDNLMNPSFINSVTESLTIQTAHPEGIVESLSVNIPITASTVTITNYNRSGSTNVGSPYSLTFDFNIPPYISSHGGQIILFFNQYDSYVPVVYDSSFTNYQYPTSIVVKDKAQNSYENTIIYDTSVSPYTVKQIVIQICGPNPCSGSINVQGLTRGYFSLTDMKQTVKLTTTAGDEIATNTFSVLQFNAVRGNRPLGIALSNSVTTLNSSYELVIVSNKIPIQGDIFFSFSSLHIIRGGCFGVDNSSLYVGVVSCSVVNSTTIRVGLSGDIVPMMVHIISYTITITSVTNPSTVQPLTYSLGTLFNEMSSQVFSTVYSISNPLPLSLSFSRSNSTYAQPGVLTLSLTTAWSNLSFSEVKLTIPTNLMTVTSSSNYQSKINNNTFEINQIYSLNNGSVSINIVNPSSTSATGDVIFGMYLAGYLSAQGTVTIPKVGPVFLGVSATTDNRVVGDTTDLTINFGRVNPFTAERSYVLTLSSTLFDISKAKYNGASFSQPLVLPISTSSIQITNLQNLLAIPTTPFANGLAVWTIDSFEDRVAQSSFNASGLSPNKPAAGLSYSFTRSSTSIGGVGTLTINYAPRFPSVASSMAIVLPANQMALNSGACQMQTGSGLSACQVMFSNQSMISVAFSGQTQTILSNITNIQPNSNLLQVSTYNSFGELIERSQSAITPSIQLNQLTVDGTANNQIVATNSAINLSVTSLTSIASNSKIVLNFPAASYLKINTLTPQDCSYKIGSTSYNNCSFSVSSQGWLSQLNLTALGNSSIPSNTNIAISLTLTNSWTTQSLTSKFIAVYVCSSDDSYLSQGLVSMVLLNQGATSFMAASASNFQSSQTSTFAATRNNITMSYRMPVTIPQGTVITMTIPKSLYSLNLSSLQVTPTPTTTAETSSTYTLSFPALCSLNNILCSPANSSYTFSITVQNNQFIPLIYSPLSVQTFFGTNPVSTQSQATLPLYTALTIGTPKITRSNYKADESTTVTVRFTTPPLSKFTLTIAPIVVSSSVIQIIDTVTFVGLSQTQALPFSVNASGFVSIDFTSNNNTASTQEVLLSGTNSFLVPVNPERYVITIMDPDYIYYQSVVAPDNPLVPYNSGVNLQRIVTTVGASTSIYINGALPESIPAVTVTFANSVYAINQQNFNISLGNITNSNDALDSTAVDITIKNQEVIAFKGSLPYTPALTPQKLTSFTALTLPVSMNVSQQINFTIQLSNYSLSSMEVFLPVFFSSLSRCCIDATCSQTNIFSCILSSTTMNRIRLTLKAPQALNTVQFTVTTVAYETTFASSLATVNTGLPSAQHNTTVSVSVRALPLDSSLSLSSWMVNADSTYTLWIKPSPQNGYLGVTIPNRILSQIASNSATYTLEINSLPSTISISQSSTYAMIIPVTPATTNITLTIKPVRNPMDSQPFYINLHQSADAQFTQIYGSKQYIVAMKQFDPITVSEVSRNATKVGLPISLTLKIATPSYTGSMVIDFPASQVVTQESCSVVADNQTLPCQVLNASSIITANIAGSAVYTIEGLTNQKSFIASAIYDLVQVSIGDPYVRASTVDSSTTYVYPRLTLGSITLSGISSSSYALLSPASVHYNFTIQNLENINGFIISYAQYFYYIPSTIYCKVNQLSAKCTPYSTNSVLVLTSSSFASPNIQLQVHGLVNFIKPANWSIVSVQRVNSNGQAAYSDVDVYQSLSSGLAAMTPSNLNIRVMFPNNYAQPSPVSLLVLIDNQFQSLPVTDLAINLTIPQGNCKLLSFNYQQSLTISCTFASQTTAVLSLMMYHPLFPNIALGAVSQNVQILPSPTSNCNNQMCDSCSTSSGQQYCFSCREGLYSSAGQCVSNCPQRWFPYGNSGVCQQCYPSCSSCFGYANSQCLSCRDSFLMLNSGTCQSQCPADSFSYNGNCVQNKQCSSVQGCRVCSGTGFCYQCLPDFVNQPNCKYSSALPPTIMIYLLAPVAVLALVSIIFTVAKCAGADSMLSQTIFSFSLVELMGWVLTVPIMPSVMSSMVLLSFLALRIIISIVSYQVFYRHNLGELSQKLLEEESIKNSQKSDKKQESQSNSDLDNCKTKLCRFIAHFNGPDSYELLKSRISQPVLSVNHNIAVQILFMVNRWAVGILMIYLFTIATFGDSVIMPAAVTASSAVVTFARLMTWDKFRSCLQKLRP